MRCKPQFKGNFCVLGEFFCITLEDLVVKEINCLSFTVWVNIKNDKLVIALLKEMTGQVERHLRSCAVISAYVEAVYPDVAVIKVFKADIGVDSALCVKLSLKEAGLVIIKGVFLPFKL